MTVPNRPKQGQKLAHTPTELRFLLGLGRDKVYSLIHGGQLSIIRVGRRLLVPADAVADFLRGKK